MIKQGRGGKILGAASIVAFKPFPLLGHYSASKFAVRGMTQAFAMELATHKITVNAYAPGIVGTAMWDLIDEEMGKLKGAKKGDTIKKFSREFIALGRTSVPKDVSDTVSFLAGPGSDCEYCTGIKFFELFTNGLQILRDRR
jgi:NAD(P)-dependent dehydrogenase (short-subunit alcohol dehydrogenase family)